MSRIEYGDDCDDVASFLRGCAFAANARRHLHGRKGQAALKELEAALLSLPEKKLLDGKFVIVPDEDDFNGGVCALGAVALKREMDKGLTRQEALFKIQREAPESILDDEDGFPTHEILEDTASFLDIKEVFAFEIVEENDEFGGQDPEARYRHVLKWVQNRIHRYSGWGYCPACHRRKFPYEPLVIKETQ